MSGQMKILQPKKNEQNFKVHINDGEMRRIDEWVKMKPQIQTGGDLFGLWLDEHTAVVQFVLGPGEDCRRTTTSFCQDISYLEKAGSYLTKQHGLCNIGQWHSHHKIPLFEPSAGDYNTVWTNTPKLGMARYIVFIANIEDFDVTVNCFLFEIENGQKLPVRKGCREQLPGESPLPLNKAVMEIVRIGAESFNEKDQVSKLPEEHSGQNETEITLRTEGDQRNPGEYGIRGIQSTDDKDRTVSVGTSASESKEIVDNSRRENSNNDKNSYNITRQNDTTTTAGDNDDDDNSTTTPTSSITTTTVDNNNESKTGTQTKLCGTSMKCGGTAFMTKSDSSLQLRQNDWTDYTLSNKNKPQTLSNNNAKNNDNTTTPSTSIATTTVNNNNTKNDDDNNKDNKNNTIPTTNIATTTVNNNNESKTGTQTKLSGTSMQDGKTAFILKPNNSLLLLTKDLRDYTLSYKNESQTPSNNNAKNNDNDNTTENNTTTFSTTIATTTVNNNAENNDDDTTIVNNNNESKTDTRTKLPGTSMKCGGTAFIAKSNSSLRLRANDFTNYKLLQTPSNNEHPNGPPQKQQDNRASTYDNVPSKEHASLKERQETVSWHDKTVKNQPVVQKEHSMIDASNEQNNPPESSDTLSRRSTLWENFQRYILCRH